MGALGLCVFAVSTWLYIIYTYVCFSVEAMVRDSFTAPLTSPGTSLDVTDTTALDWLRSTAMAGSMGAVVPGVPASEWEQSLYIGCRGGTSSLKVVRLRSTFKFACMLYTQYVTCMRCIEYTYSMHVM